MVRISDSGRPLAWLGKITGLVCAAWVLMHVWVAWRLPFSLDELKILHLGVATFIVFALTASSQKNRNGFTLWVWLGLSLFTLAITAYFFIDYENMAERVGSPDLSDVVAGSVWVLLVLWATWQSWGKVIPALVAGAMLYALYGNYLGGVFYHSGIDLPRLIGYASTYFMGTLGTLTGLSASLILHFLLFGALLQAVGGAQLIEKISLLVGSRFKSGAAQTAVISSSMLGMVSGSIPANVAITGAFTIPLMIRRGYSREFAGAVETVASAGGQITPPIMSIVAFLIAGLTGIPYAKIVIAAALPALVYYLSVSFTVVLRTQKLGLTRLDRQNLDPTLSLKQVAKDHGHLLIPVVVLTWRILSGETPARAVFYANATLVGVGLVHALLWRKDGFLGSLRRFGDQIYTGLVKAAKEAAKLGVILGSVGIVMEVFTVTGFGQRLSYFIVSLAAGEGSTLLLVGLVAVLVLFFGMGMPSAGAYLVAVLLTAPALVKLGFPLLSVHMFVFFFAMLSALTPPVCLGVLVAISISEGKFMDTALTSMRLALPGFLMPFFFLYKPAMLGLAQEPWQAVLFNMYLLAGMMAMAVFFEGFLKKSVSWLGRVVFLACAVLILTPGELLTWIGLGMLVLYTIYTRRHGQRAA